MEKKHSISISFKQFNKKDSVVCNIWMTAILAATMIVELTCLLEIPAYIPVILIGIAIASVPIVWINMGDRKSIGWVKYVITALPLIIAIIAGTHAKAAMAQVMNYAITRWGIVTGCIYNEFQLNPSIENPEIYCTALLMCLSIWMIQLCSLLAINLRYKTIMVIVVGLTLIDAYFDVGGSVLIILILFAMAICMWGAASVRGNISSEDNSPLSRSILISTIIMCIALAISIMAVDDDYAKGRYLQSAHDNLKDIVEDGRYGEDERRAMPRGDFKGLKDFKPSNEEMLKIKAEQWHSLYLRGFVGGSYTGAGWEEISNRNLYDYGDDLYWLHKYGIYGQNLLSKSSIETGVAKEEEVVEYKILNIGGDSSVFYAPYEAVSISADGKEAMMPSMLEDSMFETKGVRGQRNYSVKTLPYQVSHYPAIVARLKGWEEDEKISQYLDKESHYNEMVYELYTDIPKKARQVLENHMGDTISIADGERPTYLRAKEIILSQLNKEIKYSEEVRRYSGESDFIEELFDIGKSGYSVHYATAATLMFRYLGIPARYVEGYLITPDMVKSADGKDMMIINDNSAHAWTEYYQDGVGWIPFETTPPYMDIMEKPQSLGSSGSGGTMGEEAMAGLALEMNKDNYEPQEDKKEEEAPQISWEKIISLALIIIVIIIVVVTILHLLGRRRKLKELNASFYAADVKTGMINIFTYVLRLNDALGIKRENCSIYVYEDKIKNLLGNDMALAYREVAVAYQKAAYGNLPMTEDERSSMLEYKDRTVLEINNKLKLRERLYFKWIKCLY